ncbi:outer membrane protein transport protein, partial [Legionella sp.]
MRSNFILHFLLIVLISHVIFINRVYGAVDQPLNFFLNPAELKQTNYFQFVGGNIFMGPQLTFKGTTALGRGRVKSSVHDSLPYLLASYRLNDRFVIGLNMAPSVYGHIQWPKNSILKNNSTTTYFLYYRGGLQSSYQINDRLSIGLGINLEYNKLGELDAFIDQIGNQINKIKGRNYTGDLGLYYKINSLNYLTMAFYTGVNTYGHGTSSLG